MQAETAFSPKTRLIQFNDFNDFNTFGRELKLF